MALKTVARANQLIKDLEPKNLVDQAYPVFVKNTPVRSGNARRRTSKTTSEIQALYPYAQRLDQGWSNQSPNGMTKPTIAFIQDYIRKKLGQRN